MMGEGGMIHGVTGLDYVTTFVYCALWSRND